MRSASSRCRTSTSIPASAATAANPYLLRAAAVVTLPAGKHRLLAARPRGVAAVLRRQAAPDDAVPAERRQRARHRPRAGELPEPRPRLPLRPAGQPRDVGARSSRRAANTSSSSRRSSAATSASRSGGRNSARRSSRCRSQGSESWQLLAPGDAGRAVHRRRLGRLRGGADRPLRSRERRRPRREAGRARARTGRSRRDGREAVARVDARREGARRCRTGYPANNAIDHFLARHDRRRCRRRPRRPRRRRSISSSRCSRSSKRSATAATPAARRRAACGSTTAPRRSKGGKIDGPAITPGKPDESATARPRAVRRRRERCRRRATA